MSVKSKRLVAGYAIWLTWEWPGRIFGPSFRVLPLWRRIVVAYEPSGSTIDVLRIFSAGQDYEALMTGD